MTETEQLRRLALTTILAGFDGTDDPPGWLRDAVAAGLGGVVLFARNVVTTGGDAHVAELTGTLRQDSPDLLVAIDEEGGDVTRLDAAHGSEFPGNAALGTIDDPVLTEQVAAQMAGRLRRCGIDVNLAPVADVRTHAANPVIAARAFSSDHDVVARHVAAFVAGHQRHGVAATAKHFPGHGGTHEDSHVTSPVLELSEDEIRHTHLPPFDAAIKSAAKAIMTAHILAPALDRHAPATLSEPILTGLLRTRMGYDGVVITDGLDMHAMSRTYGYADAAVQALRAGADALCIGGDSTGPDAMLTITDAVVDAVTTGTLPTARLAQAAYRVRALRRWSQGAEPPPAVTGAAADAARRALQTRGHVRVAEPALVLEFSDPPSLAAGNVPWGIGHQLTQRRPATIVARPESREDALRIVLDHPGHHVVISVRGAHRHPWQPAAAAAIRELRPDTIVVDHGVSTSPEILGPHHIRCYGASDGTAAAAAELMTE